MLDAMTGLTDATDTAPAARRRVLAIAAASTGAMVLILLVAGQAGLPWADGFASVAAALTAMVVLLGVELRWAELVATAQSRGLVAVPAHS
ncbi:hypothetical protein OKHIL_65850 [Mycolicibacterium mageritense]